LRDGWLKAGERLLDFWDLTPAETIAVLRARAWQAQRDREDTIRNAWLTAAWQRAKKMPPLSKAINAIRPAKRLTRSERAKAQREHDELAQRMTLHGR